MTVSTTTLLLLLLLLTVTTVSATDHIVGANKGWNPGINYTLWANNQTFYVGDLICTYYFMNISWMPRGPFAFFAFWFIFVHFWWFFGINWQHLGIWRCSTMCSKWTRLAMITVRRRVRWGIGAAGKTSSHLTKLRDTISFVGLADASVGWRFQCLSTLFRLRPNPPLPPPMPRPTQPQLQWRVFNPCWGWWAFLTPYGFALLLGGFGPDILLWTLLPCCFWVVCVLVVFQFVLVGLGLGFGGLIWSFVLLSIDFLIQLDCYYYKY